MTLEAAETMALGALAWLAAEPELCGVFLGATGAGVDDMRQRAGDPEFLGFVLDFLASDEPALIACAETVGAAPEALMQARAALPGGDAPFYT